MEVLKRTSAQRSQLSSPGLDRATQYSGLPEIHTNGSDYWFPAFAGMTIEMERHRLRRPAPQHHVSLEQEFLRALAGIDLGGEDVALGVERQIVNPVEVAGHAAVAAEA